MTEQTTTPVDMVDPAQDYAEQMAAAAEFERAGAIATEIVGQALIAAEAEFATIQSDGAASYGISYYAQTVLPVLILALEPLLGEDEVLEDLLAPVTETVINHTAGAVVAAAMARQVMEANFATMGDAGEPANASAPGDS